MKFFQKTRRAPTPMVLPLIDILAILLVFFIVTTTFKKPEPKLQIRLPESATATEEKERGKEPMILRVRDEENMMLDGEPIKMDYLVDFLKQKREAEPERGIALQADREAAFGVIVRIVDALRLSGFSNVSAFTEPTKGTQQ